ncbi:uncharacterized protein LTHEOB_9941 [Neofusicoccum parvum]|uniref:Uncharacterized protein LTHEOB_9941 n=1 Tax=Neofusicoccum parvum TaxID=310453 RepID=A0ACB5SM16_9PEZI|nr:uncharacterized protein LTHEOB_9941 [Neofusicoccum parvum]
MSLFTEKDFRGEYYRSTNATRESWTPKAKTYSAKDYHVRNFSSPSELEWFVSIAIYFFFVLGSAIKIMLSDGVSTTDFRNLALSTIRPQSLTMGRDLAPPALAIVANTPQLLLSAGYLLYNRLLTATAVAGEWAAFGAAAPKALRTTRPAGAQRSTRWLQLPHRFAAPAVAASALLHYLASQALFFAAVRVYADDGGRVVRDVSGLGSSNAAMLALAVCAAALIVASMVLGWRSGDDLLIQF